MALKTNAAGLVALDLPFEAFQDTGSYHVALRVADREVAAYGLQVEEFVPERMKVTAAVDKPRLPAGLGGAGEGGGARTSSAASARGQPGGADVPAGARASSSRRRTRNFTYGV